MQVPSKRLRDSGGQRAEEPPLDSIPEPTATRPRPESLRATRALWRLVPRPPSKRDSRRRRLLAVSDLIAVTLGYYLIALMHPQGFELGEQFVLVASLPGWVLINKLLGLYDRDASVISSRTLDELPRILQSVVVGGSAIFLLGPSVGAPEVDRLEIVAFLGTAAIGVPLVRALLRRAMDRREGLERCLIVGPAEVADVIARKLAIQSPATTTELVGYVADEEEDDDEAGVSLPRVGGLDDFAEACQRLDVDRVLIALAGLPYERFLTLVRSSKQMNRKVTVIPGLFEALGGAVEVEHLSGITLLGLRGLSRTRSSLWLKRAIDVIGAGATLILLAPLLAAIAITIKLTSPGPVLFAQKRIGRDDSPFCLYKFRTMHVGADELKVDLGHLNEAVLPMFKVAADPRVTRVGRFLRRYSIDELPQLWNVLRGEMSLVGPRPLVPAEDDHVIGPHRARLELTPGLTGPWQVMGRTAIPFDDMIKLDYMYVAEWSLWNDIKLLLRTAPVVWRGTGH